MTPLACDAAAIEIEAYTNELLAIAATLRRFASTMASEPTAKTTAILDFTEAVKPAPQARPPKAQRAAQRPSAPRSPRGARTPKGDTAAAVRSALSVEERSLQEIATRAKLHTKTVYRELDLMLTEKTIVKRREGHKMLYRLVTPGKASTQPRSGQAAGTPSGPAGGPGPDHRPAAKSEVVWNGTLERHGLAPSILPPRESRR